MKNNKISGSYILQTAEKVADYTFTGENRAATVGVSNEKLDLIDLSNGSQRERYIGLITKNKIHVKGIRIITPGGAGLRSCKNAAVIYFNVLSRAQEEDVGLLSIVEVAEFNEWQPLNDYWEPYKFIKNEKYFDIGIRTASIEIDDYNIQEKYLGKKVEFKIELSIDTAGIELDENII